jgi:hypothetical protein
MWWPRSAPWSTASTSSRTRASGRSPSPAGPVPWPPRWAWTSARSRTATGPAGCTTWASSAPAEEVPGPHGEEGPGTLQRRLATGTHLLRLRPETVRLAQIVAEHHARVDGKGSPGRARARHRLPRGQGGRRVRVLRGAARRPSVPARPQPRRRPGRTAHRLRTDVGRRGGPDLRRAARSGPAGAAAARGQPGPGAPGRAPAAAGLGRVPAPRTATACSRCRAVGHTARDR